MSDADNYGKHDAKYAVVSASQIEPKTKAAGIGAGAGAIVAQAVLWGLDALFWNGDAAPDVPGPISAVVWVAIPAGVALAASYYAKHVNRVG